MAGITSKRKPPPTNKKERYIFFVDDTTAIARLDILVKVPELDKEELTSIPFSLSILKG